MFTSILSIDYPVQALQTIAGSAAMYARPLFGLGALATFLMMFMVLSPNEDYIIYF